jgi:hypothetical protein
MLKLREPLSINVQLQPTTIATQWDLLHVMKPDALHSPRIERGPLIEQDIL